MKIIVNAITFLIAVCIPAFFVLISFNFTSATSVVITLDERMEVKPFKAKIKENEWSNQTIEKTAIDLSQVNWTVKLETWEAGYIEFWKLATAFLMGNQSGELSFGDITLSWTALTIDPQFPSIISLYDPFTIYSIQSIYEDFTITQVTNGSLFVWREKDGTYSLYSIDSVVRLDFLDKWAKMTDMVLFPGMYIRFDPRMNPSLSWANLFRILQSLEPNGTEDISTESTGIEFVNPRMNTTNERDSFLMYRLPTQTRLFQMLHVLFYERVSQIDVYKEYGTAIWLYSDESSSNSRLINPGKKSHLLLLKLDGILANALKNPTSIDTFKSRIAEVNVDAKSLWLGNSVEIRLEKFLTDWRFALFGGTKNASQLADIYQAASEAVWKAPITPHAKLLQRLSDIYSKNLVTQKKDLAFSNIDTYTPTALELAKTLQSSDIQQRDYFDIALYAYNVLKKMEDRWVYTPEAINSRPTYTLIQTVLVSTDRYVKDISENDRKNITYEWIALHFYLRILSALTQSVYSTFTTSEDGKIFLDSSLRPTKTEERVRIDESLRRDMLDLDNMLSIVSERMDEHYGVSSANNTYQNIKKHISLFHAFVDILDYETYKEYEATPYILDEKEWSALPQYQSGVVLRFDPTKVIIKETPSDDPNVEYIKQTLGDLQIQGIRTELDGYFIDNAELLITDENSATGVVSISMVINPDLTSFSNPVLNYNWRTIYMLTDKKNIEDIDWVISIIPQYIKRLDVILAWNPLVWGIRFLDTTKKIAIGTYIFPLVP